MRERPAAHPSGPVALVRGAAFTRGDGTIRDVIMPAQNDLFR